MRATLEQAIADFIDQYCAQKQIAHIWKAPLVRFADARHPLFARLRDVTLSEHYMPDDYLRGASIVVSYFLPFVRDIGRSNADAGASSPLWAGAYRTACVMAEELNEHLAALLRARGVRVCVPHNALMIGGESPWSYWSQRHVAYIAGHGTFGLNNMLISDQGCVGRYYSLVTDLDLPPDPVLTEERCLYKKDGSCALCVQRCPTEALSTQGFKRLQCLAQCRHNAALYAGAKVCGKCVVELPCSHRH